MLNAFFYGRADKTKVLTFQEETKKYHKSVITEEHYTLTQEPEGMYVHHFSPANYSSLGNLQFREFWSAHTY